MANTTTERVIKSRLTTVLHVVAEARQTSFEELRAQFMAEFNLTDRELVYRERGGFEMKLAEALQYAQFLGRRVEEIFYLD